MLKRHDPESVLSPPSRYTNAIEVEGAARFLYVSGQVGVSPDGRVQDDFEAQCRTAFTNIAALLSAADMSFANVVKLGVFLTRRDDLAAYRRIRDEMMGVCTASSLVIVAGLADPNWLVEIEATAAAPARRSSESSP